VENLWNFGEAKLCLDRIQILVKNRPAVPHVWRVYVAEECTVTARHHCIVPVKLTLGVLKTPNTDWVVDAKTVRPGVMIARVAVSGETFTAAVNIINCSSKDQRFHVDDCLGTAEPAVVLTKCSPNDSNSGAVERSTFAQKVQQNRNRYQITFSALSTLFPINYQLINGKKLLNSSVKGPVCSRNLNLTLVERIACSIASTSVTTGRSNRRYVDNPSPTYR
jgi:hypothetical protein